METKSSTGLLTELDTWILNATTQIEWTSLYSAWSSWTLTLEIWFHRNASTFKDMLGDKLLDQIVLMMISIIEFNHIKSSYPPYLKSVLLKCSKFTSHFFMQISRNKLFLLYLKLLSIVWSFSFIAWRLLFYFLNIMLFFYWVNAHYIMCLTLCLIFISLFKYFS